MQQSVMSEWLNRQIRYREQDERWTPMMHDPNGRVRILPKQHAQLVMVSVTRPGMGTRTRI